MLKRGIENALKAGKSSPNRVRSEDGKWDIFSDRNCDLILVAVWQAEADAALP